MNKKDKEKARKHEADKPEKAEGQVSDLAKFSKTDQEYVLRLYVTGVTPKSVRAIKNMKAICEEYLKGRYKLEVVDVYQNPARASGEQIVAVPTLVRQLPLPLRRMVGDLSEKERVLVGLDIVPKE